MKYNYELLNNHYVVTIDGMKYLVDTGNPYSFRIDPSLTHVVIDGVKHPLSTKNRLDTPYKYRKTCELIGCDKLDGFIGTDIIEKTGLTIYKNGELEFAIREVEGGVKTKLYSRMILPTWGPYYLIEANSNGVSGLMTIDLGATVGYAIESVFKGETPYTNDKYDYSPEGDEMHSCMYHQEVEIAGRVRTMDMGYHYFPIKQGALTSETPFVGSVTNFFDEVCIFDTKSKQLILK